MAQQTRHGLYGGPRPPFASFAGKVESVSVTIPGTPAGVDLYCWNVPRDRYGWIVKTSNYRWAVKRDRVEV